MVFKEAITLLLGKDGIYTCSDDVKGEKNEFDIAYRGVQGAIDHNRQLDPSVTEEHLKGYLNTDIGAWMMQTKECLASHGYDVSALPQVTVPEFGDIASLMLRIGVGGAILAGTYAAKYFGTKNSYKI